MNSLPTEVWQYIFKLACVESTRTGSALSRTSKAFRHVLTPVRFDSVRLNSLKQIEKFLAVYEAAVAEATSSKSDPPHVRHLLLAFLPGQTDVIVLGPSFHFRDFHSWQEVKKQWNERFVSLMTRLFDLISPDLLTMTVLQNHEIPLPYVPCSFPALRELTLLHEDRMFFRMPAKPESWMEPSDNEFYGAGTPPDKEVLAAKPIFPALERLHLVDGEWEAKLPMWAVVAPRLTHLRVSSASQECCDVLSSALLATPPTLSTLIVQPHSKDRDARIANAHPGVDVVILPALKRDLKQEYWYERLPREWVSRQTGGKGAWVRSE
ncbi:hypothetical protein L226DRAFT_471582 [Lentinus tigrinus ALCF2SS1-7]|uniref:F-box domain-containing protein n=1 Tax=Lentinus tigrinus ALCF2SS1-6 TaxID=1328759 RepID=A0A5C2SAI6_9APHY|nr:hypothetical protein L227DRAFT_547810 [Lentinus tigrinus ALCF2SS1-6]RPD69560.1 hypothetical protein L226DRAFT_471582 [Lentinus tigrinus ALCF2SS1-7]